ncbi:hypothetical protein ABI_10770 [Asticcacaulis biprosthecium C19]|uniref:Uncharacterized protein n=2 Tax=Asticcacaulis biprosthecium TaxID=76891 RepID=F4QHA3_9CAUL|nr:hypothetical protein ABI_10770 [Asticcacaulis biprosthecium C19]
MAFCVFLCMAATLNTGFARIQSDQLNLQHRASGDIELADGGWLKACDGERDDCDGHIAPVDIHHDDMGLSHHHHHSETPSAPLPQKALLATTGLSAPLDLRQGKTSMPTGLSTPTPDQPPRA